MEHYQAEYERWMKNADDETKEILKGISNDDDLKKHYFSADLSFGTAGLRGIMTAGTYAMNRYTVAKATKGLADLINSAGGAERGVVIGYDSRNNSRLFAEITAGVLAYEGVRVYFFDELRPTPMVSFALRELHCIAGVNITASHNPKEYNGYKVYWEDGAQISKEQAKAVSDSMAGTDIFSVSCADFDREVGSGGIKILTKDFDEKYIAKVIEQQIDRNIVHSVADRMCIVYTPFNGAGYRLIPTVLERIGMRHIYKVVEQAYPDGNFPTLRSPNPENAEGFALGLELAGKTGCDLVIASDPDADRVGVMAKNKNGVFVTVSGNQMGALLLDYILTAYSSGGSAPEDPYAVKTIVSTPLAERICRHFGVKLYNVLTGFKYIGEVIKESERSGKGSFVFGFEESYGYLKGTYARDKDAVVASMLICEMAAYYKSKNMTLCDALDSLFERYGYFAEKTLNIEMKGLDGSERMAEFMRNVREAPPSHIAGEKVVRTADYQKGEVTDTLSGTVSSTGLPLSDVVSFTTEKDNTIIFRPSGTEPKVKVYLLVNGESRAECERLLSEFESAAKIQ